MSRFLISGLLLIPALFPSQAGEPAKQPAVPAPEALPVSSARNHFRVSAGWMWRQAGDIRFNSGSHSRQAVLPSLFGASRLSDPPVGPAGGHGDRRYGDGYVGADGGTANDGATSLWGYDSDSQVSEGYLSYHAEGSRRAVTGSRQDAPDRDWEEDGGGHAPVVQLDWWRETAPSVSLGAQLQWSLLRIEGSRHSSNFTAWEQQQSYSRSFTDSYGLRGIIVPRAPYQGAGLGNGPLIDNIPSRRDVTETLRDHEKVSYFNSIHQSLEVGVNTLSLGPTVAWQHNRLSLQTGGGFNLNIASWDADQKEVLFVSSRNGPSRTLREWRSSEGGTELLPGFYLQGQASLQLGPRLELSAFGRHEWSKDLEGSAGPSTFSVDLDGWSAGIMVGIRF